jgi:membrane associated rhomboid family serine protease
MFIVNRRLRLDISALIPLLVINLLFTFTVPNISVAGHLGGLVTGAVVAVIIAYAPRARRTLIQATGCAVVFVFLLAVTLVRTQVILG